jgi:ribonuclease HI
MTEISDAPDMRRGLHLFADGSFDPKSGHGGWAFAAYRNSAEVASAYGGIEKAENNGMELLAILEAARWVDANASGEAAVIWTDSAYAIKGCTLWRPIWRNNGWKKIGANANLRNRAIANKDIWQAIDGALSRNAALTVAWCKGHAGIGGNERADELAERGRLSLRPLTN